MSVTTDLAALYAEPFLTCPVQVGTVSVRGFLDEVSASAFDGAGGEMQIRETTLRLIASSVSLAEDQLVTVGAVGAASATGGRSYRARQIRPVGDGLEVDVVLVRVTS